jgi:predicted heme/steroid binding protein/uncharacterized membrane protein
MKEFDIEELKEFNGQDGKPVYIAHMGKVYDVGESARWKGGLHMKRHHSGLDLTTDLKAAPHGPEVFERFPQIGVVAAKRSNEPGMPEAISQLLKKYPMLRRHPHPMTVHFPIALTISTTLFNVLYLLTSIRSFETTALHCLGATILFLPVVMLTGIASWWLNYLGRSLRAIKIKLTASLMLYALSIILFTWRIAAPDILTAFRSESYVYLLGCFLITPLVIVVGWFGANLTFPIEGE